MRYYAVSGCNSLLMFQDRWVATKCHWNYQYLLHNNAAHSYTTYQLQKMWLKDDKIKKCEDN